ncbi:PPE family protein [Mycobacterium cookii]|uniref:Putative PPE family protein PPE33 n=1 Tax=Mycobacterium cookii TaxID=1775 RepID=A0A7I7L2E3_9MYCO|nr:PPE family protein [Mycobacterium cookii]MCV7333053.1 PPE family protein [Mycobacterium cookii]BBX48234.1 putative PPE family protein PPE33 [Mycobacterium cookii]
MVFDFAAQPPEVISAKLYSGPGTGSLQSAASAWDGLASELQSTAANYQSIISGLVAGDWTGPSSEAAAAAAAPYVSWLSTTAAQAEQTASQARAAASAYETALASAVSPAEIAANRTQLLSLLQTNILGQNNASIAALEAEYVQFWAQDVAAITGYSGSSQAATTGLGSFSEAPQTTNDNGQATQAAAAASTGAQSAATAATTPFESILEQIETDASNFLTQVSAVNADYTKFFTNFLGQIPGGSTLATTWTNMYSFISGAGSQATWTNVVNSTTGMGISQWKNFFIYQPWSHGIGLGSLNGGLSSPGHALGLGARAASAAVGSAHTIGKLSVPPSWAGATPAIRLAATALPDGTFAATAAPATDIPLNLLNQSTLGSLAGGALGSPASRVVASTGVRAKVVPAGERSKGPVKLDQVIAKLQQAPDEVQHWSVDEAGLDELVARLSTKPGIHAVHLTDDKAAAAAGKLATETG